MDKQLNYQKNKKKTILWQKRPQTKQTRLDNNYCGIEVLEEILGSLRITEEYILDRNRTTEPTLSKEILTASTLAVYNKTVQVVIPKNMVPDLGWLDGD